MSENPQLRPQFTFTLIQHKARYNYVKANTVLFIGTVLREDYKSKQNYLFSILPELDNSQYTWESEFYFFVGFECLFSKAMVETACK